MKQQLVRDVTIGADPEVFLRDKLSGLIVSAEGIIKGSKEEPFYFGDGFATSLDNVLAEGNIPPARTPYEFYKAVDKLIKHINSVIPDNLEVAHLPAAQLEEKYLQTENAQLYGCTPSINCWTGKISDIKPNGSNVRAAGSHIHVGYTDPNPEINFLIGRAMDLYLGTVAVVVEPKNERKSTGYGTAGNIRHCRYGVEYRSLSGHFTANKELIQWSFRNTKAAIKFVNDGKAEFIEHLGNDIQNAINNEDKKQCQEFIKQFNVKMPQYAY